MANAIAIHAAESATGGFALDEIVVTATKRAENVQVVPLSVAVVSQAALQAQNLSDTTDLQRMVSGLQFQPSGSPANSAFGVRGVTTLVASQGVEQSAGVAIDGVPLGRVLGSVADLVDIHAVEILKGPQGMLFGKNASAGLINMVTNSPQFGKNEQTFRAAYGSLNLRQYSGTVNFGIGDDSAMRVTAWKFKHDGTILNVDSGQKLNDKNSEGARLKYSWKPADGLDLNFTGQWTAHRENGAGWSIRSFIPDRINAFDGGQLIENYELAHGTVPSDTNRIERSKLPLYDNGHANAYTGQADYTVGAGTITAIVSYRQVDNDNAFDSYATDNPYILLSPNHDTIYYNQLSEELRYVSPIQDRLHYVVGLFNFRLKERDNQDLGFNLGVNSPLFIDNKVELDLDNKNYAAFGEATFDITRDLHFIAGLRRSTDKVAGAMNRTAVNFIPFLMAPGTQFAPYATSATTTYNDTSWRTGLQYEFAPDAMIYATVSRGYKGPGLGYNFNSTPTTLAVSNNGIVKPEIVHAYEVGLKSQWFERRLTANVAVYNEIFDDFQIALTTAGPTGAPTTVVANARQATTTGVDVDVNWLVTQSFSVAVNAAYDHARYTDFTNASCYNFLETPAQGCSAQKQNLNGHPLASTPKETLNVMGRYEHPLSAQWRGHFQAGANYRSGVNFSPLGDPALVQGGYTVANLSAGLGTADGRWDLSVNANNVFDKHYVDRIGPAPVAGTFFTLNNIGYDDLRTFGVALTAHF
ncbi:MAG: TonB-dependent receptor [Pseudomonadota bacterium]|nr:TonB-dependent receptor [Pseudomonadota bacterium]